MATLLRSSPPRYQQILISLLALSPLQLYLVMFSGRILNVWQILISFLLLCPPHLYPVMRQKTRAATLLNLPSLPE